MVRAVQLTPSVWVKGDRRGALAIEKMGDANTISVVDAIVMLKAEFRRLLTAH
jgi:hypothetical protein